MSETLEVRCAGCGCAWTAADLARERADRPLLISCCPERLPLNIDQWRTRALDAEADALRLHNEKIDEFELRIAAEQSLARAREALTFAARDGLYTSEEITDVGKVADAVCDYIERCRNKLKIDGAIRAGVDHHVRSVVLPMLSGRAKAELSRIALPTQPQVTEPCEAEGIVWSRVNDEPFEYAIQKGQHGDEFVKLLNGSCLRRRARRYEPVNAPSQGGA